MFCTYVLLKKENIAWVKVADEMIFVIISIALEVQLMQ